MIYYYSREAYRYIKVPTYSLFVFVLIIFGLGFFLGRKTVKCEKTPLVITFIEEVMPDAPDFTDSTLKVFIKQLNIKYPDVVYAQTLQETHRHKSRLFKDNNNLFGMKKAGKRPQLFSGMKHGHAEYKDVYLAGWQLSVIDYALYQAAFGKGLNKEEYLNYLNKSGYAEDSGYVQKIKRLLNEW
jgi:hypothetical protein